MSKREIPALWQQSDPEQSFETSSVGCYTAWRHFQGGAKQTSEHRNLDELSSFLGEAPQLVCGVPLTTPVDRVPLAFLDCEATGRVATQDRIVEVYVHKYVPGGKPEKFHSLFHPGCRILNSAIHGIEDKHVRYKPRFAELAPDLERFLQGCVPVGHNASRYDIVILKAEFRRAGIEWKPEAIIDTRDQAHATWPKLKSYTLENLMKHFGLGTRVKHRAQSDVTDLRRLFARIVETRPNATLGQLAKIY